MISNQTLKVINVLNLGGNKIWYTPVRSSDSLNHYEDTILNQRTYNHVALESSYWAFNPGPKNQANVDAINPGDYMCFILRDDEGYEILDSIAIVSSKYSSPQDSLKFWGDAQYELIIKFDSVFVLSNKLRLTYKRSKLNNILPNVPSQIFHNGYEMFRQWILNERVSSNKLGPKLIEEDSLVDIIKQTCGGAYTNTGTHVHSSETDKDLLGADTTLEDFLTWSASGISLPNEAPTVTVRDYALKDGNLALNNKSSSNNKTAIPLNKQTQKCIGLTGEYYIYQLLISKNSNLLSSLGIANIDEILSIDWSNLGCEKDMKNFEDLSLGHDITITLKNRVLNLEVKTSFYNIGYYSITRNELKEMAMYKENYFVVKVNYLSRLKDGTAPEIIIENFPIAHVIENLNRVKSMDIYL